MYNNRISTCKNDFGCLNNPFYILDRIKDSFQSSSGIDVSPYEFNKYENFKYNNKIKKCNYNLSKNNINNINLVLIILIILFLIYKIK